MNQRELKISSQDLVLRPPVPNTLAIIQSNTDLVNMASEKSSDTIKPLLNKATKRIRKEIGNMVELRMIS